MTSSVADALFTPVQQRVLALLFGQPDRTFQSSELIRLVDSGTGAVHRQLGRLADAGLLVASRSGNQKHYRANREAPVFPDLHALVIKTVGILEPLRAALTSVASKIRAAFVYGSSARGTDRAGSDIDLMIISDRLDYHDVYEIVAPVERVLGRTINPTVLKFVEWNKRKRADSFVARLAKQPQMFVIGSAGDLDRAR